MTSRFMVPTGFTAIRHTELFPLGANTHKGAHINKTEEEIVEVQVQVRVYFSTFHSSLEFCSY